MGYHRPTHITLSVSSHFVSHTKPCKLRQKAVHRSDTICQHPVSKRAEGSDARQVRLG